MDFSKILTHWYSENKRELPWRTTKNPYLIWVCEVIFQQTRINQGLAYYERFIKAFPNIESLANASEDEVLKQWEGLGYYSRARNLHYSAQYIVNELKGGFPTSYASVLQLKGVGDYTASAIVSICFNEKRPAIDGNALRVYARLFNSFENIADPKTKELFKKRILPFLPENVGDYNQAIMELGAMICTPKNPKCDDCPISSKCLAFQNKTQFDLPIKEKSLSRTKQDLMYYVIYNEQGFYIQKRETNGIWKGLYELLPQNLWNENAVLENKITHILTHRILHIQFYSVFHSNHDLTDLNNKKIIWVPWSSYQKFAFPKPIKEFLFTFVENMNKP